MYVRSPSPRSKEHGEESIAATAEVHSPRSIPSTVNLYEYDSDVTDMELLDEELEALNDNR